MIGLFIVGCTLFKGVPETPSVLTPPVQTDPPLVLSNLETELRDLYDDLDTVDGRARIILLQELIRATRFADADVQAAVYRHVQENIRIERRSLSMDVPELSLDLSGVVSEELTVDFDIDAAESLIAQKDFEAAGILLEVCRFDNPDCGVLWLQNQTMWAEHSIQVEVEALQAVQGMPDGEEKREALEQILSNYEALSIQFSDTEQVVVIQNHMGDVQARIEAMP